MTKEFTYMKEGLSSDLVEFLAQDYDLDLTAALSTLYESETFAKLCEPASGLYLQGARYVYAYLKNELQTGSLQ